jgi:hypothetical protein
MSGTFSVASCDFVGDRDAAFAVAAWLVCRLRIRRVKADDEKSSERSSRAPVRTQANYLSPSSTPLAARGLLTVFLSQHFDFLGTYENARH